MVHLCIVVCDGVLKFLLTNLDPDKWKNRRNTDTNVSGAIPVVIVDDLED
jgi:hypothetical protein